jgi:hypothetical protein
MNADRARILELLAHCQADLTAMEQAAAEVAALRAQTPRPGEGSREVILYGYNLHQWYNAAENALLRIARHFGNEIERTEWHRGLLERLQLEVPGLRPRLIGEASFEHLNALRGFRHVFRHTYGYALKWSLMEPNVERLPAAHQAFTADLNRFFAYLRKLAGEVG